MTKLLRISATVLVLALVAFLFSACGGEEQSASVTTPLTTATKAKAASSSDKPESLIDQVIVPTDLSPKDFRNSLANRRPVVVLFYMIGPPDDVQVRSAISTLESRYKGQVDFYDYLFTDGDRYGDLTKLLKVNTTPSIIMINKQAKVQRVWAGYVDSKSLEQGIFEITKG